MYKKLPTKKYPKIKPKKKLMKVTRKAVKSPTQVMKSTTGKVSTSNGKRITSLKEFESNKGKTMFMQPAL